MPHDHDHDHHHDHHHGHANDQGVRGALRYLRWLPQMWRSDVNDAVVDLIAPKSSERVIDIGAGMGAGAMRAAATGAQVTAVEPTPFMRRVLGLRRLASRHRDRLRVVDGTAEHLPVADRGTDAIWAVNTMHHWSDLEQGAAELARVIRPRGRILLVDEVFTDPAHPDYERFGREHEGEHHGFTMVEADQVVGLLEAAGLVEVEAAHREIAGRPVIGVVAKGAPITHR
jgi:SAM-dependent methyltransferase